MNWFQFEFSIKFGRWGIEFSRDDGFIGLWIGLQRYSETYSSCYPRWQWAIEKRRWPVTMKREQVPVITCVGARIVPCEIVCDEPWPDTIEITDDLP